jgi:hypothetical protein
VLFEFAGRVAGPKSAARVGANYSNSRGTVKEGVAEGGLDG